MLKEREKMRFSGRKNNLLLGYILSLTSVRKPLKKRENGRNTALGILSLLSPEYCVMRSLTVIQVKTEVHNFVIGTRQNKLQKRPFSVNSVLKCFVDGIHHSVLLDL
jgi:hypothetical protein